MTKLNTVDRQLSKLNPRFCELAISMIRRSYIAPVNRTLKKASVFKLTVPHLGTIRTHGNKKKKISVARKKYQREYHKKKNNKTNWTDLELLK